MCSDQNTRNTQNRLRRLRRFLAKHGCRLHVTPGRHWTRDHFGVGYMVTEDNSVRMGASQREYDATLDECEWFCSQL